MWAKPLAMVADLPVRRSLFLNPFLLGFFVISLSGLGVSLGQSTAMAVGVLCSALFCSLLFCLLARSLSCAVFFFLFVRY